MGTNPAPGAPILALDAASPRVSVAVGLGAQVLALRDEPLERSSRRLLEMIDEVLREAGLVPADLGGIAALRGPGSFTGLRVGLATALGLHQALGIPATALPTLEVLASLASPEAGPAVGAVDALRGEWAIQVWPPGGPAAGAPASDLEIRPIASLPRLAPCALIAFGAGALVRSLGSPAGLRPVEPGPLAPAALALLAARPTAWDPALLTAPLYGRPPAVTLPRPRPLPTPSRAGAGSRPIPEPTGPAKSAIGGLPAAGGPFAEEKR